VARDREGPPRKICLEWSYREHARTHARMRACGNACLGKGEHAIVARGRTYNLAEAQALMLETNVVFLVDLKDTLASQPD